MSRATSPRYVGQVAYTGCGQSSSSGGSPSSPPSGSGSPPSGSSVPPFLLQGSYRNMNRIAEKVLPIMNDRELQTLIVSNYENAVQTCLANYYSLLQQLEQASRPRS